MTQSERQRAALEERKRASKESSAFLPPASPEEGRAPSGQPWLI